MRYYFQRAGAGLPQQQRNGFQFFGPEAFFFSQRIATAAYQYNFIFQKRTVVDGWIFRPAFNHTQVNFFGQQGLFNLSGIAAGKGKSYIAVLAVKAGQQGWNHVLRHGGAGAQSQLSAMVFYQAVHFKFHSAVEASQDFYMLQQGLPGSGQADFVALAFKQFLFKMVFQFVNMPGNGGLGDVEFFSGTGKVEALGHSIKHLQAKVKHGVKVLNTSLKFEITGRAFLSVAENHIVSIPPAFRTSDIEEHQAFHIPEIWNAWLKKEFLCGSLW